MHKCCMLSQCLKGQGGNKSVPGSCLGFWIKPLSHHQSSHNWSTYYNTVLQLITLDICLIFSASEHINMSQRVNEKCIFRKQTQLMIRKEFQSIHNKRGSQFKTNIAIIYFFAGIVDYAVMWMSAQIMNISVNDSFTSVCTR